jgi:hypothetical protein
MSLLSFKKWLKGLRCSILLLTLVWVGCPSPAAPPAPPAELPSALRLPDPRINTDEIASTVSAALSALVGPGGEFSDEIAFGPNRTQQDNFTFGTLMAPLLETDIPVGETITTFVTTTDFFAGPETTIPLEVKMDFSDFDYDGNGVVEGCSGHTAALPICVRLWVGGERFMQGVFDQFPTSETPGAGRFRIILPDVLTAFVTGTGFVFNYDHSDETHLTTETLNLAQDFVPTLRRSVVTQEGVEGSAKKTVNFGDTFELTPGTPTSIQYIGSFLQDEDFWSGSFEATDDIIAGFAPNLTNVSNACAQISTGIGISQGTCVDLGIDTTGIDFIDFSQESDFEFSDFPTTPTF